MPGKYSLLFNDTDLCYAVNGMSTGWCAYGDRAQPPLSERAIVVASCSLSPLVSVMVNEISYSHWSGSVQRGQSQD